VGIQGSSRQAIDTAMMARCVAISRQAAKEGEYPFGTVIALGAEVVAETANRTNRDGDISRHAEVIALSAAQKTIGRDELRRCTLYTNVEPCAMCSYCIREAWIGRVIYAIESPVMGGLTKWNILRDHSLSDRVPQIFGPVPEVVSGVHLNEAQQAWRDWNPLIWEMIKLRGLLTEPHAQGHHIHVQPGQRWPFWHHLSARLSRINRSRIRTAGAMPEVQEPKEF
jgi:tRNA(adenine34) deaminase